MDYKSVMKELEKLGTAQNRKIYKRHGSGDNVYGVSFANLYKLQKKIKINHELALKLWDSKNIDAQSLANMIIDPEKFTEKDAEKWIKSVTYYMLAGLVAGVVAKTSIAEKIMYKWMKSKKEFIKEAGYSTLSALLRDGKELSVKECKTILKTIEKEIHTSPNRAKHAMNMALIAIGMYNEKVRKDALAAAKRIGKVKVDHGETTCKTPDAISYINKAVKIRARFKKK